MRYWCEQCVLQLWLASRCWWWNREIESRHLAADGHGVCAKDNIRICSARLAIAIASGSDRGAEADDVVGNREDAEVAIEQYTSRSKPHASALRQPLRASHSRREDLSPILSMSLCTTIDVLNHVMSSLTLREKR